MLFFNSSVILDYYMTLKKVLYSIMILLHKCNNDIIFLYSDKSAKAVFAIERKTLQCNQKDMKYHLPSALNPKDLW